MTTTRFTTQDVIASIGEHARGICFLHRACRVAEPVLSEVEGFLAMTPDFHRAGALQRRKAPAFAVEVGEDVFEGVRGDAAGVYVIV